MWENGSFENENKDSSSKIKIEIQFRIGVDIIEGYQLFLLFIILRSYI